MEDLHSELEFREVKWEVQKLEARGRDQRNVDAPPLSCVTSQTLGQ